MDLHLRIPELTAQVDAALETRKVYVEEWVEGLPYADPLRVFRALFDRLREWNHAPLKTSLRLDLLELLLPAYLTLVERHTQLRTRDSTTAFERYRDEADAARQVSAQFAYGYKLALLHGEKRPRLLGGDKPLRLATQRAALTLAYGLLHAYHQYLPTVRHTWPELHELYAFAERSGFHQAPGFDAGVRAETGDSVEAIYARIALLSAADPLHQGYGDVWRLFTALSDSQAALRIASGGSGYAPDGTDLVLASTQGAPRRRAQWRNGLPEDCHFVNSRAVATHLRQGRALPGRLLAQFTEALEHPAQRTSERVDIQGRVRVACGLACVHHFSGGAAAATGRGLSERAGAPDEAAQSDGENAADDTIDIDDFDPEDTLPSPHLYVTDSWHLANQSQSGVCLTRERRSQNLPMVGEVVGLRTFDDNERQQASTAWTVGVVRWLTIDAKSVHRIGVEILSSNARPVRIVKEGHAHPAALVLASTDKDQIRLIAPLGIHEPGTPIVVDFNGREIALDVQRTVLATGSIECLDCKS